MAHRHFLIVYDRSRQVVLELVEFAEDDRHVALAERFAREEREFENPNVEVVLLSADSVDALRETHGRYFKSMSELAGSGGDPEPPDA